MILHLFMSREAKGLFRTEPFSAGSEGLVEFVKTYYSPAEWSAMT